MREFYYDLLINGKPILAPDSDMQMEMNDLDSDESGRDEGGFMHRIVLRKDVKKWGLSYSFVTQEEYKYMESLFKNSEFDVEYRDVGGYPAKCRCYRSNHSILVRNARTGLFKNYNFSIIEC